MSWTPARCSLPRRCRNPWLSPSPCALISSDRWCEGLEREREEEQQWVRQGGHVARREVASEQEGAAGRGGKSAVVRVAESEKDHNYWRSSDDKQQRIFVLSHLLMTSALRETWTENWNLGFSHSRQWSNTYMSLRRNNQCWRHDMT